MKNNTTPDGTRIYTPRKKMIPSGQTNIITDPALTHSEPSLSRDENVELAKKWVDDNEL